MAKLVILSKKLPSLSQISSIFYMLMTLPLLCREISATGQLYYPPFINLALDKPVELFPENAICGLEQASEFCESRTQQQNLCDKLECHVSCEVGGSTVLPHHDNLFGVQSDTLPKECGIRRSAFRAPESSQDSYEFLSTNSSGACSLSLMKSSLILLKLQSSWSVTLTFWIWNNLEDLQQGTVAEIASDENALLLKVFLSGQHLMLMSGSDLVEEPAWVVPRQQWNHVTLQIYEGTTSLFLNGSLVSPSQYGATRLGPGSTDSFVIGDSHAGGERFVGFLDGMDLYYMSVSNREVMEMFTGTLPETRVLSDCRCKSEYPALKDSDMSFCVQNEGEGQSPLETYRITRNSYPIEYVNDGKLDTQWISQPPTASNNAPIQETQIVIDLEQEYEVRHVEIKFYSPYPSVITIERQMSDGDNFEYWQFYSSDCESYTSIPPNEVLSS